LVAAIAALASGFGLAKGFLSHTVVSVELTHRHEAKWRKGAGMGDKGGKKDKEKGNIVVTRALTTAHKP
jgi:hypothetical protein